MIFAVFDVSPMSCALASLGHSVACAIIWGGSTPMGGNIMFCNNWFGGGQHVRL